MAVFLHATGPAYFFLSDQVGSGAEFLGTMKSAPMIAYQHSATPVQNDLGGLVPFDFIWQGTVAAVTGTFNRFDHAVLRRQRNQPRGTLSSFLAGGQQGGYEQGAIMVQDGWARGLTVLFPYFGSTFNTAHGGATGGYPAGYLFPYSFLMTPDDDVPGSQDEEVTLGWVCARKWGPGGVSGGTSPAGNFVCWTELTAFPSGYMALVT